MELFLMQMIHMKWQALFLQKKMVKKNQKKTDVCLKSSNARECSLCSLQSDQSSLGTLRIAKA